MKTWNKTYVAFLIASLSASIAFQTRAYALQADSNRIHLDDSDWWSGYTKGAGSPPVKPENKEPALTKFKILGVELEEPQLGVALVKIGKATVVGRGDASTGRDQACYVSEGSEPVYLIFENGELDSSFYLFKDDHPWHGRELCATSGRVSKDTATDSGLKLGLARSQVEAILGRPTASFKHWLIYSYSLERKRPIGEFKKYLEGIPKEREKELEAQIPTWHFDLFIAVRFSSSTVDYLTVSEASED